MQIPNRSLKLNLSNRRKNLHLLSLKPNLHNLAESLLTSDHYQPCQPLKGNGIMKKLITFIALLLGFSSSYSFAAESLVMATGAAKKGYSKIFKNINDVCNTTVPLTELNTTGGVDNVGELAAKRAHLGLVQVDVFQSMTTTDDAIARLKAVMLLNSNMLHIVVNSAGYQTQTGERCTGREAFGKCITGEKVPVMQTTVISKVEQLKGLPVAAVGSAQVLARRYFNTKLSYGLNILDVEKDADAFAKLKSGEVRAVLTMAAYPHGPIEALKASDGLTLLNSDLQPSGVYKVAKKNYKNLGVYGYQFLTAPNLLVARPVDPNGEIGQKITSLKTCIADNLSKLQEGSEYEPSWSDAATLAVPDDLPSWSGVGTSKKK